MQKVNSIGLLVLLIITASIPLFMTNPYYLDLIIIWMLNSVLAMTFLLMLRTGLISMAIVFFYGIGAYASTMLVTKLGLSFWFSLPASALIAIFIALIISLPLIKYTGFTFVILTSVIGMMFGIAVGNIKWLGGYNGVSSIPAPNPIKVMTLPPLEFVSKVHFFYLALFLCMISVVIMRAFYSAWTGRAWTAIGLNQRLAESLGINVFRFKLMGFLLASGIAGLLGSFFAHYQSFIQPESFGIFSTIYLQIYAILGGIGFPIAGPIVGTAVMTFIPEVLRFTREAGNICLGAIVILIILFLPKGILSIFKKPIITNFFTLIGKSVGSKVSIRNKTGNYDPEN